MYRLYTIATYCACIPGLILGLRPANERRRYKVTPSLIGWAQTKNEPWYTQVKDLNRTSINIVRDKNQKT